MSLPLDIHANSVSPYPQGLGITGTTEPTISADAQAANEGKSERHMLRRKSGQILKRERVSKCGQRAIGGLVTLHHNEGHTHFGAVETCGSVWHCPVCVAKISEGRRAEIDAIMQGHREAGGVAFMATLTIPHLQFQSCAELRRCVANSWRGVKSGKAWHRAREGHGWIGDIRALEITHGKNGWHPHLHILIFFKPGTPQDVMHSFGGWLFDAWETAVHRAGFGRPRKSAFRFDQADSTSGAADYVSKWGASLELTKAHTKRSKGGRTPWQILRDYAADGLASDEALFAEYAYAFKGARQLTWSRSFKTASGDIEPGIRQRYLTEDEVPDEELAVEPQAEETQVATLDRALFHEISNRGATATVLSAHEADGLDGVLRSLTRLGVPWRLSEIAGIERGRFVPLISLGPGPARRHSPGYPGDTSPLT